MKVFGAVLDALGLIGLVVGLIDLPQQWRRWAGVLRRLRGETGRWATVAGGLVLQATAALLGVPTAITFTILLGGVLVAASVRLYQARQGLPNWLACHEWPDALQGEGVVSLAVRSLDRDARPIAICRVLGPHGVAEIDHSRNIFGVPLSTADRDEAAFPGQAFRNSPTRLADGRYRVEWWASQGVGVVLVRRDRFRVRQGRVTRSTTCMYEEA